MFLEIKEEQDRGVCVTRWEGHSDINDSNTLAEGVGLLCRELLEKKKQGMLRSTLEVVCLAACLVGGSFVNGSRSCGDVISQSECKRVSCQFQARSLISR